ncbi:MAG: hypothetical protein MZW92_39805 [Comamonadaceae bacterium]|nr:hypothetical protein [Comamonadaceae bacterium]
MTVDGAGAPRTNQARAVQALRGRRARPRGADRLLDQALACADAADRGAGRRASSRCLALGTDPASGGRCSACIDALGVAA